jgi:hypothetical protein
MLPVASLGPAATPGRIPVQDLGAGKSMGPEDQEERPTRWVTVADIMELVRRFHAAEVQFLIYGGIACILHGFVRATEDLDICVGDDPDNIRKALHVLSEWGEGYASELTVDDVLENVVVRIGEDFTVDLASRLWKVEWEDAWARRRVVEVEGVAIPFLSRRDLIHSKKTYREKDQWDVRELEALADPEAGQAAG